MGESWETRHVPPKGSTLAANSLRRSANKVYRALAGDPNLKLRLKLFFAIFFVLTEVI